MEAKATDNHRIKACPNCDQCVRIPTDVGGVVMACPSCGHNFYSGFKMRVDEKSVAKEDAETGDDVPAALKQRFPHFFKS